MKTGRIIVSSIVLAFVLCLIAYTLVNYVNKKEAHGDFSPIRGKPMQKAQ